MGSSRRPPCHVRHHALPPAAHPAGQCEEEKEEEDDEGLAPLRQCPLQVGSRTIGRVRRPRGQARTKRRRGALTRARRSSRRRQIRKTKPEEIDSFPAFAVPRVVSSLESYPSLPAWARTCACAVRVCVSAVSRLSTCGVSPSASFDPPWTRMRKDGGMGRSASIMESAAPAPG